MSIVGARPNFMKIAPIIRALGKQKSMTHVLVHTGQHYDEKMSKSFFRDLGIPKPNINLEVGSGSHAQQTAQIMKRFEPVIKRHKPDLLLVVGDVNSTMACSLVASKLRIPVAHVEAGLRSFDRNMPEETNRLVTDSIADILMTTSKDADEHLIREGIPKNRIFFVGNVMIDTLMNNVKKADKLNLLSKYDIKNKAYALVTLHRPSNVDDKKSLDQIFSAIANIQKNIKILFPVHPRTRKNILKLYSKKQLSSMSHLVLLDPLGYIEFLNLMKNSKFVITDSGGIQEETTVLGVPCLTVRENTERPITITEGSNILVGVGKAKIIAESMKIIKGKAKKGKRPRYWDGKASERIVNKLYSLYKQKKLLRK